MLHRILADHADSLLEDLLGETTKTADGCLLYAPGTRGKSFNSSYGWFSRRVEDHLYFAASAHVACWILIHREPVPEGHYVLHRCDNKRCVNPKHLWSGSPADNMNDKVAKGRQTRGSQFKHARLTEESVKEIRRRYREGISMPILAKEHRVTLQAIAYAIHRKTWKHVP
jgi:hypothetical protein